MESAQQADAFSAVAPYYDRLMEGVPYRFWVRYIGDVWDRFGIDPFTVLDVACGTGTVALILAERGYQVTGTDRSEAMLVQARIKAQRAGAEVSFIHQNATDLDLAGPPFDCVLCLYDSLNNILEPALLTEALRRAHKHTKPGGLFIFDINTEYAFAAGMFNQKSSALDGPLQYVWRAEYDREARLCTITMDFRYAPEGKAEHTFQEVHVQRAYAKQEVLGMLADVGFGEVSVFDAYTFSPPRRRSDRVFYVARRPESETR